MGCSEAAVDCCEGAVGRCKGEVCCGVVVVGCCEGAVGCCLPASLSWELGTGIWALKVGRGRGRAGAASGALAPTHMLLLRCWVEAGWVLSEAYAVVLRCWVLMGCDQPVISTGPL